MEAKKEQKVGASIGVWMAASVEPPAGINPTIGSGVGTAALAMAATHRSHQKKQETSQRSQKQPTEACTDISKEIWNRGDRAIATSTGAAFLGGLFGQLPGAIAGAILGAAFGLFVRSTKSTHT